MSRKRIRAHANPLSDTDVDWPLTPDAVPWHEHYPAYIAPGNVPTPLALKHTAAAEPAALQQPAAASASTGAVAASVSSPFAVPPRRHPLCEVRVADVGCGFGGMSVALAEIFPDRLVLGLEIRDKVVELVQQRIEKLRKQAAAAATAATATAAATTGGAAAAGAAGASGDSLHATNSAAPSPAPWAALSPSYAPTAAPFTYENVSVVKTNFMKFAPNYFRQGQLDALFFLFADPHFKKSNHRRRVIHANFLDIYAYILRVGGLLYTITDVADLHEWEVAHLGAHPLFERIPDAELHADPCFIAMQHATEEGQKVTRLSGQKYPAVYRRIEAKEA